MKAYKVIYQHGHFIDIDTKKRLIPVQGQEYIIAAGQDAFTEEDPKISIQESLSAGQKAAWANKKFRDTKHGKLASAGDQWIFRVGNSRTVKGDESYQYVFLCTLLEDLYLYLLKGKQETFADSWRLAECNCQLEYCVLGGMQITTKISAESLNKLFSQTVMFYFSNQRSGAVNALKAFFKYEGNMEITFDGMLQNRYKNLAKFREEFVK